MKSRDVRLKDNPSSVQSMETRAKPSQPSITPSLASIPTTQASLPSSQPSTSIPSSQPIPSHQKLVNEKSDSNTELNTTPSSSTLKEDTLTTQQPAVGTDKHEKQQPSKSEKGKPRALIKPLVPEASQLENGDTSNQLTSLNPVVKKGEIFLA